MDCFPTGFLPAKCEKLDNPNPIPSIHSLYFSSKIQGTSYSATHSQLHERDLIPFVTVPNKLVNTL